MVKVRQPHYKQRRIVMKDDINSLSHSKWRCKYHIVFAPKYRRKEIYGDIRKDIGVIVNGKPVVR